MQKSIYTIILCLSAGVAYGQHGAIKKYYKEISAAEFAKCDSAKTVVRSKYGTVYHAFQKDPAGSGVELDFFVLERMVNDRLSGLFKMDELTQIKNDSTFMLCDPPLKVTTDTINWVNGVWFYKNTKPQVNILNVDSIPPNLPEINYQSLSMGVYQFRNNKLVKISDDQSEKSFYGMNVQGFFYLPNPGFFYRLTRFDEIK